MGRFSNFRGSFGFHVGSGFGLNLRSASAAVLVFASSASAFGAARIDIRCDTTPASAVKTSLQFGISRYTHDLWGGSVSYGPSLQSRVQDVDVGQFMNDDKVIFLKVYTPELTPADVDLSGLKLRLKSTGVNKWSGSLSSYTQMFDGNTQEKESAPLSVVCKTK